MLTIDPPRGRNQQPMIRNNQKVSPSDFSFTLVDKPLSSVETMQVAACHSSSPPFTPFPQESGISSCINLSTEGGSKDESQDFVRFKKRSCGVSGLIEQREVQQRRIPYSIRKAGKEVRQFG